MDEKDNLTLKDNILQLRAEKKSYRQIATILGCAKSSVMYHCRNANLHDIGLSQSIVDAQTSAMIKEYCKDHTSKQASQHFGLSLSTINNHREPYKKKHSTTS